MTLITYGSRCCDSTLRGTGAPEVEVDRTQLRQERLRLMLNSSEARTIVLQARASLIPDRLTEVNSNQS